MACERVKPTYLILRNVGDRLVSDATQYRRRTESSATPLRKLQDYHVSKLLIKTFDVKNRRYSQYQSKTRLLGRRDMKALRDIKSGIQILERPLQRVNIKTKIHLT